MSRLRPLIVHYNQTRKPNRRRKTGRPTVVQSGGTGRSFLPQRPLRRRASQPHRFHDFSRFGRNRRLSEKGSTYHQSPDWAGQSSAQRLVGRSRHHGRGRLEPTSQMWIWPLSVLAASHLPDGEMARHFPAPASLGNWNLCSPEAMSHTVTYESSPVVKSALPSGEKQVHHCLPSVSLKSPRGANVCESQNRTRPSRLQETTRCSVGEYASRVTRS